MSGFELYRYTHLDGTAKDWAWCEHPGTGMEVRWGRAGRLVQKATYPVAKRRTVLERALAKQRKGYCFVGWCRIDDPERGLWARSWINLRTLNFSINRETP